MTKQNLFVGLIIASLATSLSVAAEAPSSQRRRPNPKFTIVCSDAGTSGYEGFPDVCRTQSGELLCVLYAGYGHASPPNEQLPRGGRIVLCRSSDDGKTWSPATIVVDTPVDDRDPSIVALPDGDLLVVFFGDVDINCGSEWRGMHSVRSTDGGKTWSKPQRIPSPFTQNSSTSTPPRLMSDGRLLLPVCGNYTW
jgi:Neuraminidase (sialidase)